ncbi:hypothetical protein [Jiangella mangrovi]|uniref:Uncharacterized protein n=1 Tax=Jiangella mangrovi TaxID=1524084 RepID=A0A7W9GTM6_9ACTN|nr:hypothetical protein [Jiangella mangrovi]MBB5789827.1 hypothetical protein [Jiangella mangrovi]
MPSMTGTLSAAGATLWRGPQADAVVDRRVGAHELAPAVLGRVLPGTTTIFRAEAGAGLAGMLAGARTDRVAPPRMSVAPAPVAVLDPPVTQPARGSSIQPPAGVVPQGGPGPQPAAAAPITTTADDAPAPDTAGPGATGPDLTDPPHQRWRLTDLDPADLAELADLVLDRIEGRVRGELERRGRRGVPGVF